MRLTVQIRVAAQIAMETTAARMKERAVHITDVIKLFLLAIQINNLPVFHFSSE